MTKLKRSIKREIELPKMRRPLIISLDLEGQKLILYEKGSRLKYSIRLLALYSLLVFKDMKDEG